MAGMKPLDIAVDISGVDEFIESMSTTAKGLGPKLEKAMWKIVVKVQRDAKRRVPVSQGGGTLRNSINIDVQKVKDGIVGEIGTNLRYGVYIEFGTKWIAEGDVLALGEDPDITDEQAIKDWPAKRERGAVDQQMPWLRPAINANVQWILSKLSETLEFD